MSTSKLNKVVQLVGNSFKEIGSAAEFTENAIGKNFNKLQSNYFLLKQSSMQPFKPFNTYQVIKITER